MNSVRDKLSSMFQKVMAGTVTREEGAMLINDLVKTDQVETLKELGHLIENPPPNVYPKTVLHTIALTRNSVFNGLLVMGLEHQNEDVSILAAGLLAQLKTDEARKALIEHLDSGDYNVRKASARALVEGFGAEGIKIVTDHILSNPEYFCRASFAQALAGTGREGIEALVDVLRSGRLGAMANAAEALSTVADRLEDSDLPVLVQALTVAGDGGDPLCVVQLLKVFGALNVRARPFKEYIKAFAEDPSEQVRIAAVSALDAVEGRGHRGRP